MEETFLKNFLKLENTLVIGDIHLHDKSSTIRNRQIACIKKIVEDTNPEEILQLGDFFDKRSPSPEAMLDGLILTKFLSKNARNVVILRGNHDSSNKSDDGVTALSLYAAKNVKIVVDTEKTDNAIFIPHFEDEGRIKHNVGLSEGTWVFGHFGYEHSFNSLGDMDFSIPFDTFIGPTILGHIHKFNQMEVVRGEDNVTLLGTPYTTNYTEWGKQNYVGIIKNGVLTPIEVNHGLRYCVFDYADLEDNKYVLSDNRYGTRLRVYIDKISEINPDDLIKAIINEYGVDYVDIKYKPSFNEEEMVDNSFVPDKSLVKITDRLLDDYINSANTLLPKEDIMEGFRLLKNEYQKDNNS